MTEKEFQELNSRIGSPNLDNPSIRPPRRYVAPKPKVLEGPISMVITMHGHCPSKKNLWEKGGPGGMFLNKEVKAKIDTLTMQALFQWGLRGPVAHPELTIRFFVAAPKTRMSSRSNPRDPSNPIPFYLVSDNRDQDGMYTTILDCLQAAGVIVNDNIRWNNGRKILECVEFVPEADERVEITVSRA